MELDDLEFERQLGNGTLPLALFDHLGHLRLAWIYLGRYGEAAAIEKACRDIRTFASSHGDADRFHRTLTVASIKVVNHFVQKSQASRFEDLLDEFPVLKDSFKRLLERHYSQECLNSKKARLEYLPLDLFPFDPCPTNL